VTAAFLPVILGSDINAYGMARSFHEEYGVRSLALASFPLAPTRFSRIVDVKLIDGFGSADAFLPTMLEQGRSLAKTHDKLLLIPCGDNYSELVSRFQSELRESFIVAAPPHDLLKRLVNKASFYELCARHGIDHPRTRTITAADAMDIGALEVPFDFPVALKPSDSVAYLDVRFPGRKKAFVLGSIDEVRSVVARIYQAGYADTLVLQEYIPGDDSQMRVINAYLDAQSSVRMICLGNPLLEDHAPDLIGNYTAIRSTSDQVLYDRIQAFLEGIGYVGFANLDLKVDARDGSTRLLELNPRQGRSSFYVTLAGYNLARYVVQDRVLDRRSDTVYGSNEVLWMQIPRRVFFRYTESAQERRRARELIRQGRWGTTLGYALDSGLRRRAILFVMALRYLQSYRRHFRGRSAGADERRRPGI
jgi:D-aspartate ligase